MMAGEPSCSWVWNMCDGRKIFETTHQHHTTTDPTLIKHELGRKARTHERYIHINGDDAYKRKGIIYTKPLWKTRPGSRVSTPRCGHDIYIYIYIPTLCDRHNVCDRKRKGNNHAHTHKRTDTRKQTHPKAQKRTGSTQRARRGGNQDHSHTHKYSFHMSTREQELHRHQCDNNQS